MTGSSAVPEYGVVVLDCPEPKKLADFYAALLEWPEPKADHVRRVRLPPHGRLR